MLRSIARGCPRAARSEAVSGERPPSSAGAAALVSEEAEELVLEQLTEARELRSWTGWLLDRKRVESPV